MLGGGPNFRIIDRQRRLSTENNRDYFLLETNQKRYHQTLLTQEAKHY